MLLLVVLLLLLLVNTTISNINTAPPTIQTQGSAYQVCCVLEEDDVVVVAVTVLSCAQAMAFVTVKKHSKKAYLKNPGFNKCFIFIFFGYLIYKPSPLPINLYFFFNLIQQVKMKYTGSLKKLLALLLTIRLKEIQNGCFSPQAFLQYIF